jgi:hypothetical protein
MLPCLHQWSFLGNWTDLNSLTKEQRDMYMSKVERELINQSKLYTAQLLEQKISVYVT